MERAPVVVNGGLDRGAAELLFEGLAQSWRHADIKEHLHPRALGAGGAVRVAGGGGADSGRSGTQDGGSRPPIHLEVPEELVQGNTIHDPIE